MFTLTAALVWNFILFLIAVGVLWYLISLIPMKEPIPTIINLLIIVFIVAVTINFLFGTHSLPLILIH